MFSPVLIVVFTYLTLGSSHPHHKSKNEFPKFNLNEFKLDDFKNQFHELVDSFQLQLDELESGSSKSLNFKRPASPVTPSYFKFGEIDTGENGETLFKDRTNDISPSWLSNNVYTSKDHGMDSVVQVHKGESGGHFMSGFLGEHLIKWDGEKHNLIPLKEIYDKIDQEIKQAFDSEIELGFVTEFPGLKRKVRQETANETENEDDDDEEDDHITLIPSQKFTRHVRNADSEPLNATEDASDDDEEDDHIPLHMGRGLEIWSYAYPEILFIVDYNNSKHFNFDEKKIIDYLSVMINSVNLRYSEIEDPKITMLLVGVYVTKSPEAEADWPWLDNGRIDAHKLLNQIGVFAYKNKQSLPNNDLIALITANKFNASVVGLAKVDGACGIMDDWKMDEGVSINHDFNGVWYGKHTIVHELAHNLGSHHDGKFSSEACSWELGHIMSYMGWGQLSRMKFSSCSLTAMKSFFQTTNSDCLRKNQSTSISSTSDVIFDRIDVPGICKSVFPDLPGEPKRLDHDVPDKACRLLFCQYDRKGTFFGQFVPEDKAKCGRTGTCQRGFCIGDTPYSDEKELNAICNSKFDGANLVWEQDAADPGTACRVIHCSSGLDLHYTDFWFGNGAPCGNGGTCTDGKCVGYDQYKPTDTELFNAKCKKKTNDPAAKYEPSLLPTPDSACTYLPCTTSGNPTLKLLWMGDGYPCGTKGKCLNGQCKQ